MFKPETRLPAPQRPGVPRPKPTECCTDLRCESGLRNNYFVGKRITAESFRVEQSYLLERRRLLNRAIHGWGVVYGYEIEMAAARDHQGPQGLQIGPGLALDKCGRELLQAGQAVHRIQDLIMLEERDHQLVPVEDEDAEEALSRAAESLRQQHVPGAAVCWLLSVHYAEQRVDPIDVDDCCRCKHEEWDRICETVRYSLRRIPCGKCCADAECDLKCGCATGPCCNQVVEDRYVRPDTPLKRGGCCLCHAVTDRQGEACGPLYEIDDPCARVQVDLQHGVPLACLRLFRDERDRKSLHLDVEACGPRRLVKNNDLLFDLIRGCDLTRIVEIGWKDWHRRLEPVPFEQFADSIGPPGHRASEYVTRDLWVKFSRPVRKDTVRPDSFAMTILCHERGEGWWEALRVPIVRIDTTLVPPDPRDPPDHIRSARIVVGGRWFEDAIRGTETRFDRYEARVEIEVRGDLMLDCNGQALDLNPHGLWPAPTGNGAPGGPFFSGFRLAAKLEGPIRHVPGEPDHGKGASS